MPTFTILEKNYGKIHHKILESVYYNLINGLSAKLNFVGTTERGWIKLDVEGDDKAIVLSLLNREIGFAPISLDVLEKFCVVKGKIISSKKLKGLYVDFGVPYSDPFYAFISKKWLQIQLVDGKDISFKKLVELFCLYENFPIEIKLIENAREDVNIVEAILSERQLSLFKSWISYRFDRLIILGSLFSDVEKAIKASRHSRDIIKIESLGFFEHVVLCKLGTDAVGLIPKLGRQLKSGVLVPFSPKKILKIVDAEFFD